VYTLLTDGLWLALILSLVPMVAIAVGAGFVSLIQAVTQIQEQSLLHLARIVVVAVVVAWGGYGALHEVERLLVRVIAITGMANKR
jgi:type III secretory pathway component EscS